MFLFNRNALAVALIALGSVFLFSSPAFASPFTMNVAPQSGQVDKGGSVSFVATATCQTGPCEEIGFNISGLPAGVSPAYSTGNCAPTCSTVVTLSVALTASPIINLPITIEGQGSSHNSSATYTLTIIDPSGGAPIDSSWLQTDSAASRTGFNCTGNGSPAMGPTMNNVAVKGSGNNAGISTGLEPAQANWAQKTGTNTRTNHASVWDPVNNRMIVFAGAGTGGDFNDLWSYNTATNGWTQLIANGAGGSPEGRYGSSLLWDPINNRALLFGGLTFFSAYVNDLWSYNPATNGWTQLIANGAGGSPPGRSRHGVAWDQINNRLLVFGGYQSGNGLNDLWSYNPATNGWTQLSPTGGPPSTRYWHGMTWDQLNNKALVFGGYNNSSYRMNDLWSYDPLADSWTQKIANGAGGSPVARENASATWNPASNRMLVFGGYGNNGFMDVKNDLWSYNPATNGWTQLSPAGGPPPERYLQTAVWDANSFQMLIFGGYGPRTGSNYLGDLWALEGKYLSSGSYASAIFDTSQTSTFTNLTFSSTIPTNYNQWTQTTDADFGGGTMGSNATVSGTGAGANVGLSADIDLGGGTPTGDCNFTTAVNTSAQSIYDCMNVTVSGMVTVSGAAPLIINATGNATISGALIADGVNATSGTGRGGGPGGYGGGKQEQNGN